jgi:hypothetical protein
MCKTAQHYCPNCGVFLGSENDIDQYQEQLIQAQALQQANALQQMGAIVINPMSTIVDQPAVINMPNSNENNFYAQQPTINQTATI